MHRFYQEQYQLDGGKQDRYITGSRRGRPDHGHLRHAASCRSTSTCTAGRHPDYAISDRFFQAAFGGSFLNHQWLVAAATPTFSNALGDGSADDLHSLVDANGMPNTYPLYTPTGPVKDASADRAVQLAAAPPGLRVRRLRGQHDPADLPALRAGHRGRAAARRRRRAPTIGDRLSERGRRLGLVLGRLVERQRRRRRARAGRTAPRRAPAPTRRRRRARSTRTARTSSSSTTTSRSTTTRRSPRAPPRAGSTCATRRSSRRSPRLAAPLPAQAGQHHQAGRRRERAPGLRERARRAPITSSTSCSRSSAPSCAKDTMVIVTYDEFGGQWDHVSPPGQGTRTPGPHDEMGPVDADPGADARARAAARVQRSTTRRTTRRRSWPRSSTASGCGRSARATRSVQDLSTVFSRGHGGRHCPR